MYSDIAAQVFVRDSLTSAKACFRLRRNACNSSGACVPAISLPPQKACFLLRGFALPNSRGRRFAATPLGGFVSSSPQRLGHSPVPLPLLFFDHSQKSGDPGGPLPSLAYGSFGPDPGGPEGAARGVAPRPILDSIRYPFFSSCLRKAGNPASTIEPVPAPPSRGPLPLHPVTPPACSLPSLFLASSKKQGTRRPVLRRHPACLAGLSACSSIRTQ